jgi:hypothetical protein
VIEVGVRDDHQVDLIGGDAAGRQRVHQASRRLAKLPGPLGPEPGIHQRDTPADPDQQTVVGDRHLALLVHPHRERRNNLIGRHARSKVSRVVHGHAIGHDLAVNRPHRKAFNPRHDAPSSMASGRRYRLPGR